MVTQPTIKEELAELISQVTEQSVKADQVSHRLAFIMALSIPLVGVMYADNQITESEKEKIKSTLSQFIPPQSHIGKLIKPIFQGIQKQKTYAQKDIIEKFASQLTASEKLLIVGLCCELAGADEEIAEKEEKYIEILAKTLDVDVKYCSFFYNEVNYAVENQEKCSEMLALLDPHHFQDLDPAFMRAAEILRTKLNPKETSNNSGTDLSVSYAKFNEFRQIREQLTQAASGVLDLIQQSIEQELIPEILRDEAMQVLDKVQSQVFRIAVVGEFSQGKSTLLNALLGSEVQPVRAIPCSGIVTVLKYGERCRVICRYKNGQEKEVPIEDYKELASISQEAALLNISEELSKSDLEEIVFEHPNLELCRQQVEIVDSPGLNEHPDRTAITHQLLKNTDAVIFLANALRPFTQGEMELLYFLKQQMQDAESQGPSESLFVVVNFMDLLRRDEDIQHVKQRAHNFLMGSHPIIMGEQRLHFISAQAALEAILEGKENEYLRSFRHFTQNVQSFLVEERGALVAKKLNNAVLRLTKEAQIALKQSIKIIDGEISLSESGKIQIIEQMGAASGREVKLRILRDKLKDEVLDSLVEAWQEWIDGVGERIAVKSIEWTSEADNKEEILKDFTNQFLRDLSEDLDGWLEKTVKNEILIPKLKEFDKEILESINSIYENLKSIDLISGSILSQKFSLSLSHFGIDMSFGATINPDDIKNDDNLFGFLGSLSGGGLLVGGLAFLGLGFLPLMLASLATGAVIGFLFGDDPEKMIMKMKQEVYDKGFEKFFNSTEEIQRNIGSGIAKAIEPQYESAIKAIQYSISILDEILKKQDDLHKETVDIKNKKKSFASQGISHLSVIEERLDDLPSANR